MNVTLRQLHAFVLVARLGSFTRAAQAMHVTQSALSLLVRELEGTVNTRLFDRTTRAVALTAAGSEFFPQAQRILNELESALAGVDKFLAKEHGRVVVAAPLLLSSVYLPPVLSAFRAEYPGIQVTLQDTLPTQVLAQVSSGQADIGIGTFAANEAGLQRTLLFTEAMVAVFPVGHAFSTRRRLTWAELATEPENAHKLVDGTTRVTAEMVAALEAVTAADIQKAAQTYFTRSRLSVAHVLPEETSREGAQP